VPSSERCCQLRHDSFPGAITLVGKPEIDVPIGVLRSLWKWARIEEQS
jgi:predicted RNA binding protein YcfA (HicA-like mRNA interferase family)